jgi:hypothetical protein
MCETQFARESALLHELPMARVVIVDAPANFDPDWRLSDHLDHAELSAASGAASASGLDYRSDAATSVATATPGSQAANGASITAAAIAAEAARLEELLRNLPQEAGGSATAPPSLPGDERRADELNLAVGVESPPVAAPPLEEAGRHFDDQTLDNPSTSADEELDAYDDDFDEAAYDEADEEDADRDEHAAQAPSRRRHREFVLQPSPKRRPRASTLRSLFGIVGGGVVGLLLAGYALIWLRGPELDFFQMASWLPDVMLPESMQASAGHLASDARANDAKSAASPGGDQLAESDDTANSDSASTDVTSSGSTSPSVVDDPAVTQANHTSPSSAAGDDPSAGDSDAASVPEPLRSRDYWPATPIVADLKSTPLYSLDDLTEVVVPAETAARTLLGGDFSSAESQTAMGHAYIKLCAVAERYTLTDPDEYGSHLFTQQLLGKGPLQSVAGSVARRGDLARITAKWWTYPKRQNQGIVVVGRVKELHPQGRWTEATLDVEGVEPPLSIPVLMDGVRFTTGSEVAVAGVIVKEPGQSIDGYEGSAPQVVVGGYLFDPAKFAETPAAAPEFSLPGN